MPTYGNTSDSSTVANAKQVASYCCDRCGRADPLIHHMVLCEVHLLRRLVLLRMLLLP